MSPALDVAIGLVFIYALASLVITAATELLAAILQARGRVLSRAIGQLLGDRKLTERFFAHPLIDAQREPGRLAGGRRPSYLTSASFSAVIVDLLARGEDGSRDVSTLRQWARAGESRAPLQSAVAALDDGGDLEAFKRNLERWFDAAMDRASGWYKRSTDRVVLGLAALLTVALNIDTTAVVHRLWSDSAVRSALVVQAEAWIREEARRSDEAPEAIAGPPPQTPDVQEELTAAAVRLLDYQTRLESIGFPIGWSAAGPGVAPGEEWPGLWTALRSHGLGWALTVLALSLGAPFWFDVLSLLVRIRASGRRPATA